MNIIRLYPDYIKTNQMQKITPIADKKTSKPGRKKRVKQAFFGRILHDIKKMSINF